MRNAAAWLADQGITLIEGSLDDPAALTRALTGCAAVIHCAAWTGAPDDPTLGEAVNVAGTEAVLQAAAGVTRVIYFSSVAVYGLNASPLIDESAPTPLVGQAYPDSKISRRRSAALARPRPGCCHRVARQHLWPTRHGLDDHAGGADRTRALALAGWRRRAGQPGVCGQCRGRDTAGSDFPGRCRSDLQLVRWANLTVS